MKLLFIFAHLIAVLLVVSVAKKIHKHPKDLLPAKPEKYLQKCWFEKILSAKLDTVAHAPKRFPKWILETVPFPGEEVYVIPNSNPENNPNAVQKLYKAVQKTKSL